MYDYDCAKAQTRMQRPLLQVFKNALVVGGMVRVRTRLVGRIGSGPRLVGRVGSVVRVSDSFHILSCAVVRAVARSGFRDTLQWYWLSLSYMIITEQRYIGTVNRKLIKVNCNDNQGILCAPAGSNRGWSVFMLDPK